MASGGAAVVSSRAVVTSAAFPVPNWDRYEFISTLGRGGMGSVYKARDRRLGRIVALKFIHGDDPGLIQRFLQEARAQARLTSPHICKIHEAGFVDSKPYIAMELVDGASLDKAGPSLSLVEKVQVTRDVAMAMHLAHEEGIVHRDLKPSNIMLERLGGGRLRPVVMDFGLARDSGASASQGLTESGAVIGTPAYMSPEQARGEARRLDRRSDVYSLGATLYDLLSGKPPFQDETVVNLLLKVVNEPPVPLRSQLPDVPEALELIVSKCLNKEAEQRYPSALALAQDLDRYLNAERVVARRLGYGYRLRYFAKRNRSLTAVIAALVVAAIALLFVGIRGRIVALRKEREAREQAALAQTLGQSVKDLEWLVRTAYLLPLHDTAYEKGIVRSRMATITADLARAGASGARLGAYVLGRGHLALHEWDRAHEQLARAEGLGYRDAGLDYALGRVLGEKYSRALDEARKSGDKSFVEKRKKELETEFLIPARTYLQKSRGHDTESPSYVEALLDFYNEHYDAALINAHMARKQAPWLYEALKLEGDVHMVRALAQRDHGDNDSADHSFAQAVARYEEAATIGHSDPQVHEALAEAWIRQEEMDLYRGVDPTPKMEKALVAAERAVEAEPEAAGGYIKQAFAYMFATIFDLRFGNMQRALSRAWTQANSASAAIAQDPRNALAYDIHGNAYRFISEINIKLKNDYQESLSIATHSLKKSLALHPRFPWALNDLASLFSIYAQNELDAFRDPTPVAIEMSQLATQAIDIDDRYVTAYSIFLTATAVRARWAIENGKNPREFLDNARQLTKQVDAIQPNYLPVLWDLSLIMYYSILHASLSGTPDTELVKDFIDMYHKIVILARGFPDIYALSALAAAAVVSSIERCCGTESAKFESGVSDIAACYRISSGNPECRNAEVDLLSARISTSDQFNKNPHKALLSGIFNINADMKSSIDHLLTCAQASLRIVLSMSNLTPAIRESTLRSGMECIGRVLTSSPRWPRARAIRGGLLLAWAKAQGSAPDASTRLRQSQEDFAVAFAGNPLLRIKYGELAKETERLAAGR
jgi:serine/threonine-protein kinase